MSVVGKTILVFFMLSVVVCLMGFNSMIFRTKISPASTYAHTKINLYALWSIGASFYVCIVNVFVSAMANIFFIINNADAERRWCLFLIQTTWTSMLMFTVSWFIFFVPATYVTYVQAVIHMWEGSSEKFVYCTMGVTLLVVAVLVESILCNLFVQLCKATYPNAVLYENIRGSAFWMTEVCYCCYNDSESWLYHPVYSAVRQNQVAADTPPQVAHMSPPPPSSSSTDPRTSFRSPSPSSPSPSSPSPSHIVIQMDRTPISISARSEKRKPYTALPYDSNVVCGICLEDMRASREKHVLLHCKHLFCRTCIDEWLKENSTCPQCRCSVK
jgi:hypothetical protein